MGEVDETCNVGMGTEFPSALMCSPVQKLSEPVYYGDFDRGFITLV